MVKRKSRKRKVEVIELPDYIIDIGVDEISDTHVIRVDCDISKTWQFITEGMIIAQLMKVWPVDCIEFRGVTFNPVLFVLQLWFSAQRISRYKSRCKRWKLP